jgi:hypothetical protein
MAAADACSLAGSLNVAQFLGPLQQTKAGFDKPLFVAHEWCPSEGDLWGRNGFVIEQRC